MINYSLITFLLPIIYHFYHTELPFPAFLTWWLLVALICFGSRSHSRLIAVAAVPCFWILSYLLDSLSFSLFNLLLHFSIICVAFLPIPRYKPSNQDDINPPSSSTSSALISSSSSPSTTSSISFLVPPVVLSWPWFTRPISFWDLHVSPFNPSLATLRDLWDASDRLILNNPEMLRRFGPKESLASFRQHGLSSFATFLSSPRLSPMGRFLTSLIIPAMMNNRLALLRYYSENMAFLLDNINSNHHSNDDNNNNNNNNDHPLPSSSIKKPIIIIGLPRTGSTLMQRLLACDPDARATLAFEMEVPLPPLQAGADPLKDPRIAAAQTVDSILRRVAPGHLENYQKSHPWVLELPEEEFTYLSCHMALFHLLLVHRDQHTAAYVDWALREDDKGALLAHTRRFLEVLQAHRPPRSHWVLKSPMYSFYPGALLREFPDARVVVTHRDPTAVVPSVARLMASMSLSFYGDYGLDQRQIGRCSLDVWIETCTRVLAHRRAHPQCERQFADVMYDDFIADPVATVRRLYAHFQLPFSQEFEQAMRAHLDSDPRVSHGRHSYSLQEFGLTAQQIVDQAPEYFQTYFPNSINK